jgi:hypothetical protein
MHRCRIGINPEDVAMALRLAIKKFLNRQKRKKSTGAVPSCSELSERFDQVQFLRKMVRAAESGGEPAAGKLAFQASRRVFGGH